MLKDLKAKLSVMCAPTIDCKKYGQSVCDVTHRLSEEWVLGCLWGVWAAPYLKILENTKYKSFKKDTEVVLCVVSDHGRDVKFTRRSPLSAVNQS